MVVRRTDWEHTQLNTHDDIEILWASAAAEPAESNVSASAENIDVPDHSG